MPRIKLNFRHLTIPEKIAKARQIVTALTENATAFPAPTPSLASVTAGITNLESAFVETQAARQTAKARTSAQSESVAVLDRLIAQLSAYVESVGGDDEELIRIAGMDTRIFANTTTEMPTHPLALEASAGEHEGEVHLSWHKVEGARSYVIEKTLDPTSATGWAQASVSTKARATINGLTRGARYWFRVAALGTAGASGWSDPALSVAP